VSIRPANEPDCTDTKAEPAIANAIDGRPRDLGGFTVRRLLPAMVRRRVGPFTFFDEMGERAFAPGEGIDVRPHPHIGLATVTYLFEGEIVHRDSLGTVQTIRPGDINWMTAGRGIVHSERTDDELRKRGSRMHGLQLWVALPLAHEEVEPSFDHYSSADLPEKELDGVRLKVLAGGAYGVTSPVKTLSPLFYVDATMPDGSTLAVTHEHRERAAYVVEGAIGCGGERAEVGRMLVFAPGADVRLRADSEARIILLGGAPLDGERHLFWNFVSSSKERIERAKRDWKEGRFPKVPGDDVEFIPLPE
jgi:redox-sensitive bicupin YhaK (pirin superfamily)